LKALLDTHVFIWAISEPQRLSSRARQLIEDGDDDILVSVASAWEMAIKVSTGKLKLKIGGAAAVFVQRKLVEHRMTLLPIQLSHLEALEKLPLHHRDPFDRLLVAQAIAEGATLITVDAQLKRYKVKTIS
jgi:PIN domain nuclease of toxin-antitoxin system